MDPYEWIDNERKRQKEDSDQPRTDPPRTLPPNISATYACPECGAEVDIRKADAL